jgi:hypothetical protein
MKLSLPGIVLTVATTVLAQPLLTPAAHAGTNVPAPGAAHAGTGWLATQLTDGVIHNATYDYDDLGMTMDIGLSMDEVGGDQALVRQLRASLSTRIQEYAAPEPTERYSGALAKSLVFAQVSGADPATYGGLDLVAETEGRIITSGPSAGRLQDLSAYGDYANSFGQALAVRGLSAAGSAKAGMVTDFLLQQQCSSGFFRVFFTTDPAAAGQSCAEGVDGTDTDATAFVVGQLAAVSPRPARVDAAVDRAVAWLVATQRADGSFVGSAYTPDPNSNSTGLAASALAAAGRCEQAGRAAEWVGAHQVGPQPSGSPLAGDEGAIAYSDPILTQALANGISDDDRPSWWRTSVQAVAGLTHLRGSASALTVASSGTEPGSVSTLTATGAKAGERFCLSGPGITGSRTLVVGADGTLTGRVTLPAAAGPATYTLTGRDGSTTHRVAVGSSTARGSVSGVRLVGPTGYRQAGAKVALEVLGAAPGARFGLRGPGVDATVVVGSDGVLTRTVTLPRTTTTVTYALLGADGQVVDGTRVLGRARLKVSTLESDGPRTRVLVRRLAPRERVRLVIGGETVARGRANAEGRFVARVRLPHGRAQVRIRAVGQFAALRSGSTTLSLR